MATREAHTKGGTPESGTSYKKQATSPGTHENTEGTQRPKSPPVTSAPDGHKIK